MIQIRAFRWLLLLTSLGWSTTAPGQQVSESEVYLQRLFIEATREMALGNDESALELFEQVTKKAPENDAAWFEMARLELRNDHPERALRHIDKARQSDSKNDWYLLFEAEVLEKLGRFDKAGKAYEELVSRQPEQVEYYHRWARTLLQEEEPAKAIDVYDQLEKEIGLTEDIARRRHTLYLGMGNNKKATAELERLAETFPGQSSYYYLLADFYEREGETQKALDVYRKILERWPEESKARLRLAGATAPSSDRIRFVNSLEPIFREPNLRLDPKIKRIIPLIQEVANTGDTSLANALLDLMAVLKDVHPGEAKTFAATGDLLYYSGRREEALAQYRQALQLDDTVFAVWEQALTLYAEGRQYDELLETAEEAMDIFPNQARLYIWSGMADIQTGNADRALATLQQAELMSSGNELLLLETFYWLGIAHTRTEDWEKAEKAFRDALEIQPESALVLSALSLSLSESGQAGNEPLRLAEKSLKIQPDLAQGLQAKGWYYYRQKSFDDAAEWLNRANERADEQQPAILEQLGDVYFQLGEADRAISYWEKAKAAGANSPLLDRKIADRKLYE